MAPIRPKYSREMNLIELAIAMAVRPQGVTLEEIECEYGVSHRTAERLRDALLDLFPEIDALDIPEPHNKRHYGFTAHSLLPINFYANEIASLEKCKEIINHPIYKKDLSAVIDKIKYLTKNYKRPIDEDTSTILSTERSTFRQGYKYKLNFDYLLLIRRAIKSSTKIKGTYKNKKRLLEPLGLNYSSDRVYLIAREKAKGSSVYVYALHRFSELESTQETFEKGDFNLNEFLNDAFGIYRSEPRKIVLNFDTEMTEHAATYDFHPNQKSKYEKDGTYTVSFTTGGTKELFWHIFKWGRHCIILEPESLKEEYKRYINQILALYE